MNSNYNYTSLQPLLFDFDEFSFTNGLYLSEKETEFASYWNTVISSLPSYLFETNYIGRKGYRDIDILAVRCVMLFFKQNNIKQTLSFLKGSPRIKEIVGMIKVPSESVVSRKTKDLIQEIEMDNIYDMVTKEYFENKLICNLTIDSTPIDARETPVKKVKDKVKKKRGRKSKGTLEESEYLVKQEEDKKISQMAKTGDVNQYLSTLENRCSITGKMNSKGYMQWRIGYKVHLAVDDFGIPISYFVSGASVHDSKVAIPLLRKAKEKAQFLYALMDGGYSSNDISEFTKTLDAVPIIDYKADRNGVKIAMDPAKKIRYKARTTVERTNSELKDCFLAPKLYSRGEKSIFDLKLAVLLLTLKKIKHVIQLSSKQKAA